MKRYLLAVMVALIASTSLSQMKFGRVSTNDTIDWRSGDMVKLRYTTKNPTVVITNYSPGRVKYVQMTTATGLNAVTFPLSVVWTNDPLRGMGLSPGDTVYYIMTSVDSTIIATKLAEYKLKTWYGPGLTSGNYNPYPDTTAPSAVTDLDTTEVGETYATFTFTAPTDDRGVSSYDFRRASGPLRDSVAVEGSATIAFVAEGHDVASGTTISATVSASGTNRVLLVGVTHYKWGSETISSVKVGSTDLTLVETYANGSAYTVTYIYKLINPATGNNTVTVTLSSSAEASIIATAWSGVDQTTATGNTGENGAASGTNVSSTVSSSTANTVVDFVTWNINGSNITGTPAGTQIANYGEYPSYNPKMGSSYATGAASKSMTWTLGTSTDWSSIATELTPAAGQGDTVLWVDATRGPNADPPSSGTQTYTFSGLTPATTYHVRMKSSDAAGNVSALSNEITFTTDAGTYASGGSGFPYGPNIAGGATGYYLSPTGSNANSGKSAASPKQKWYADGNGNGIREILGTEAGYDTVWIRAGTYAEVMDFAQDGFGASNPVVVMRYGTEKVIFSGNATDNDTRSVRQNGKRYIVIQGIKFECNEIDEYLHGYVVDLSGSDTKFLYNYVVSGKDSTFFQAYGTQNTGTRGITFGGWTESYGYVQNIEVANCYVRGWNMGIVAGDASNAWIHHDTVHATMWSNVHIGTWSSAYRFDPRNIVVEYCDLDTSWGEDNIQFESHGSNYSDANPWNSQFYVVRNNKCKDAEENGIDLKGCAYVWVYDNTIVNAWGDDDGFANGQDNGSGDALTVGFNNPPTYYARPFACTYAYNVIYGSNGGFTMTYGGSVYNNTVLNNRRTSLAYNNTTASDAFHGGQASNPGYFASSFVNNVIANHYTTWVWTVYASGVNLYVDNNAYYDTSGTTRWRYRTTWPQDPTTLTSLSSWQSHLSGYGWIQWKDANARTSRPVFENAGTTPTAYVAAYDFAPKSTDTTLRAKGRAVTVTTNSGSGSTTLRVAAPTAFHGPIGTYTEGQRIWVRDSTQVARIVYAYFDKDNQANSYFTLDTPLTWDTGDPVHLAGKPGGSTPNIGAK